MTGLWTSGYARLAVLTALAAVVAYALGELLPYTDPIPAAITAAVATRATFHHAAKETAFQILGALLGAAIIGASSSKSRKLRVSPCRHSTGGPVSAPAAA